MSGGNQQKTVAARELTKESELVVISQPTRGLDIRASEFIKSKILQEVDTGKAILLFSSDLEELLILSDLISVIYRGEFVITSKSDETNESEIGKYMTGLSGI